MNNKVIARIRGGLGNQMFIYAMAHGLAERSGSELVLDTVSGFERDFVFKRQYMLDRFSPKGRVATYSERLEPGARLRRSMLRKANLLLPFSSRKMISQTGQEFDSRILELRPQGNLYLEGYWQSEKYFEDIATMVRSELAVPPTLSEKQKMHAAKMESAPSVAIHMRFFDDFEEPKRRARMTDYYRKAIEVMEQREPKAKYYVFSDRPKEAYEILQLPADRSVSVENDGSEKAAHQDLWLIGQCHHAIIADSTFSWWAAWLGETANSTVVAPRRPLSSRSTAWGFEGLVPDRWQTIG